MYELINGYGVISTAIIALTTYYLTKFYITIKRYPPGSTPLPILGNVLMLKGTTRHPAFEFVKLRHKYGPVVTFWAGIKPLVFIFDLDIAKNAFKRSEFSGRPKSFFGELLCGDIAFTDYGHQWESLRRVTHTAIRYTLTDPEFKRLKNFFYDMFVEFGPKIALIELMPFMEIYYRSVTNSFRKEFNFFIKTMTDSYRNHLKDYDKNVIRDFCDALILAKNEALAVDKEWAPYLKDHNLGMSIFDLFLAGINSSQAVLMWAILVMANDPEMQSRLRAEIESEIGDRMPVQKDRNRCHYVNAFICETLRFRTVGPFGFFHKTMVDTEIDELKIPKDTVVFAHLDCMQTDDQWWTNGHRFDPNRFLESDGQFISSRPPAFVPFGTGRRVCPGEKMVFANLFLVLVRFLQLTSDYDICLADGVGSADFEPVSYCSDLFQARRYKILLQERHK